MRLPNLEEILVLAANRSFLYAAIHNPEHITEQEQKSLQMFNRDWADQWGLL